MSLYLRVAMGFSAILLATFALAPAASAAILQISALGFARHDGNVANDSQNLGLLLNANGECFAPVNLPTGVEVCSFSLVYRDNDSDGNITAQLVRKGFAVGGNAFSVPVILAEVQSTGAQNPIRKATTANITQPTIAVQTGFYYVKLILPAASNFEVAGIQIDYRPNCP